MHLPARLAMPALCLIVFTDLMGFGIILPLLPYVADTFGGSGFAVGLLFASYSLAQLAAAPLLGRASDRCGRKPVLLLALSGSVASALLLANATSLSGLLAARVVAGGSVAVAHAFAADTAPDRIGAAMGSVQSAMALARATAPAVAGTAYDLGPALPYFGAAVLAAVAAACVRTSHRGLSKPAAPAVKENSA